MILLPSFLVELCLFATQAQVMGVAICQPMSGTPHASHLDQPHAQFNISSRG